MNAFASLFPLAFGSSRRTARRRLGIQRNIQYCDVLEDRLLLSPTNQPPQLDGILATESYITAEVIDDGSGFNIIAKIDVGGDGTYEMEQMVVEGDILAVDLFAYAAPNQETEVKVKLIEPAWEFSSVTVSSTTTIQVQGVTVDELGFDWLVAADGVVSGLVDKAGKEIRDSISVQWRQVGSTSWNIAATADQDGSFYFELPQANGEIDFEFSTVHTYGVWDVIGPVTRVDDMTPPYPPYSDDPPPPPADDPPPNPPPANNPPPSNDPPPPPPSDDELFD